MSETFDSIDQTHSVWLLENRLKHLRRITELRRQIVLELKQLHVFEVAIAYEERKRSA